MWKADCGMRIPESHMVERLRAAGCVDLRARESMATHCTLGVGGAARVFAVAPDTEALAAALATLTAVDVPWFILGGGSNLLIDTDGFDGVALKLGEGFRAIATDADAHRITAGAAAPLAAVVAAAERAGLGGLEWAVGLPGTLGGALAGNAGAAGADVGSLVDEVAWMDASARIQTLRRGTCAFGYRTSGLVGGVVLNATFDLTPTDDATRAARRDAARQRRRNQPLGERSAGCVFKNPPGDAAGRLIDAAGLKGERLGGARVSERHANFIVTEPGASARDVAELIARVRARVFAHSGVRLDLEIRTPGVTIHPAGDGA